MAASPFPELDKLLALVPDMLSRVVDTGRPWLDAYGLWAVALALALETLLFAGFIVPGFGVLVAAGYLAAAGVFPLWQVLALGIGGAVLGDQLSYLAGRLAGRLVLRRHLALAGRLERALQAEGPALLLFYHYAQLLRAVLPCAAGLCRYPWARFTAWDTLGVALWAGLIAGIGYTAHGLLHAAGNIALMAVNAASLLLMLFISWRIYRRLRQFDLAAPEADQPAPGRNPAAR